MQTRRGVLMRAAATAAVWMICCTATSSSVAQTADDVAPLAVSEIAPGVFVHEGVMALMTRENEGAIANVGFVVGSDAVAVIDTGGSVREGRRLLAAIRAHSAKPIRYVINTHMHPDHVFGNAAFTGEGVALIGHKNLPQSLATHGAHYLANLRASMGEALISEVKLVAPTQTVADTLELDLGDRRLTLAAWPTAHSDNDLTVLDHASGTLFTGDLLFARHVPVLDGRLLGWLAVLDRLARVDARRAVPGHGPPVDNWLERLADERRYLERLAADIRTLIKRGAPIATAVTEAGGSERDHWELFEAYNRRNATAAFAELEWE
jgi:quinoprotein relay system zinc metallohydrolase 2